MLQTFWPFLQLHAAYCCSCYGLSIRFVAGRPLKHCAASRLRSDWQGQATSGLQAVRQTLWLSVCMASSSPLSPLGTHVCSISPDVPRVLSPSGWHTHRVQASDAICTRSIRFLGPSWVVWSIIQCSNGPTGWSQADSASEKMPCMPGHSSHADGVCRRISPTWSQGFLQPY